MFTTVGAQRAPPNAAPDRRDARQVSPQLLPIELIHPCRRLLISAASPHHRATHAPSHTLHPRSGRCSLSRPTSSEGATAHAQGASSGFELPRRTSQASVLPLGSRFNLDGSMMYMTFATIFIAQAYGIGLTIGQEVIMLLVLIVTSKGMAGPPRASLVVIAATMSMFRIPEGGLLLILAVDHSWTWADRRPTSSAMRSPRPSSPSGGLLDHEKVARCRCEACTLACGPRRQGPRPFLVSRTASRCSAAAG